MLCIVGATWLWAFLSPDVYDVNPRIFMLPGGLLLVDSVVSPRTRMLNAL